MAAAVTPLPCQARLSRVIIDAYVAKQSEAVDITKECLHLMSKISARKIKFIRTDNSGEFINMTMDSLCSQEGILHEVTARHTLQNALAEHY